MTQRARMKLQKCIVSQTIDETYKEIEAKISADKKAHVLLILSREGDETISKAINYALEESCIFNESEYPLTYDDFIKKILSQSSDEQWKTVILNSMKVLHEGIIDSPTVDNVNRNDAEINNKLNSTLDERYDLLGGDMLFPKEINVLNTLIENNSSENNSHPIDNGNILLRKKRNLYTSSGSNPSRWPRNTVPYYISDGFSSSMLQRISASIHEWNTLTCLKLVPYNSAQHDHTIKGLMRFNQDYSRCAAAVGYLYRAGVHQIPYVHDIYIGPQCSFGSVVHEIGHIIGLVHVQSRPDRDEHVSINFNNIQGDMQYNFNKYYPARVETKTAYDLNSVMHYGPYAFSYNGGRTISSKISTLAFLMGQRYGLSYYDRKTISEGYGCASNCGYKTCEFGAFLDSSCKCVCPEGFTGDTCNNLQIINEEISSAQYHHCTFQNDICNWIQDTFRDTTNWKRVNGKTSQTSITSRGNYQNTYFLFLYDNGARANAMLLSRKIQTSYNSEWCMIFYYQTIGYSFSLKVDVKEGESLRQLWQAPSSKQQWTRVQIHIRPKTQIFRVRITGQVNDHSSAIAIDDITISYGSSCNENGPSKVVTTARPIYPQTQKPVDGKWSKWGEWSACDCNKNVRHRLRQCNSPPPSVNGRSCFGRSAELAICLPNSCQPEKVEQNIWAKWSGWSECDCKTNLKERRRTCLKGPCQGHSYEEKRCSANKCNQVDKYSISTNYRPSTRELAKCSWDIDRKIERCLFSNNPHTTLKYYIHSGSTRNANTGPTYDHTTGYGKYVYVDSRFRGKLAQLETPYMQINNPGRCLVFFYHMHGINGGVISLLQYFSFNKNNKLWSRSGNQGTEWKGVRIPLPVGSYSLVFQYEKKYRNKNDVALDDISFHPITECNYPSYDNQSESDQLATEQKLEDIEIDNVIDEEAESLLPESLSNTTDLKTITVEDNSEIIEENFIEESNSTKSSMSDVDELHDIVKRQTESCGGKFYLQPGQRKTIQSPGYPHKYGDDILCTWLLYTDNDRQLKLTINNIDIENGSNNICYDSIELRFNYLGQRGIRFCGKDNRNYNYVSRAHYTTVIFRSDWTNSGRGFQMTITAA
ncbi:hypothetical protein SNEBB_002988 [Seison nebaliae]|nr:hypothetical protein SNEBB_002988 [Seison nebaliae]